jgi:cytochrome bd-type quinol oxidase subunit 2
MTAVGVVALAALVAVFPRWTLDYLHVLAWPAVALIVILLFRVPHTRDAERVRP